MIRIERPVRFIIFLLALTGLVVGVILGSIRLIMGPSTIQKSGSVTIEEGAAAGAIWEQMVEQDFTPRTLPWRYHAWRQEAAGRIKAGTYEVTVNETVADVVRRLASGTTNSAELTVTYPEGFTIQQIAARTAARGLSNEDDFIHAATPSLYVEEFPFLRDIPPGRDLEGYLFPDTYRFLTDDTPRDIIRRMLATFERRVVVPGLAAPAVPTGRTLDQILIMASIIEREVISDEDMAQVAGVLWRRLDNGVGLGADATIRYALDHWDGPLSVADLAIDSPYNTRKYAGLPPGPISNPGVRAIVAAVNPTPSEYYYYLSTPEGQTIFSKTLDEHNLNKAKYLR